MKGRGEREREGGERESVWEEEIERERTLR